MIRKIARSDHCFFSSADCSEAAYQGAVSQLGIVIMPFDKNASSERIDSKTVENDDPIATRNHGKLLNHPP
jgi:hypothetical protein